MGAVLAAGRCAHTQADVDASPVAHSRPPTRRPRIAHASHASPAKCAMPCHAMRCTAQAPAPPMPLFSSQPAPASLSERDPSPSAPSWLRCEVLDRHSGGGNFVGDDVKEGPYTPQSRPVSSLRTRRRRPVPRRNFEPGIHGKRSGATRLGTACCFVPEVCVGLEFVSQWADFEGKPLGGV